MKTEEVENRQNAQAKNILIQKVLRTETWNRGDEKIKIVSSVLRSDDMG